MRRFLSAVLTMVIFATCLSGIGFAQEQDNKRAGFAVYNDFEADMTDYGFTDVLGYSNNFEYVQDDEEHGRVLKVLSPGATSLNMYSKIEEPVVDGGFLISFDMKFPKNNIDPYIFLRFIGYDAGDSANIGHDPEKVFLTHAVKDGGFDYFPGMDRKNYWHVSNEPKKYTIDKWHHIDVFADMEARKIYYYMDNSLYATDDMKTHFNGIYGFYMTPYGLAEPYNFYIDNWAFMKTDFENIKPLLQEGHAAPDRLKSPIKITWQEKAFGKNYFDTEGMPVTLSLNNTAASDSEVDAIFRVLDQYGEILWTQKETIKFKAKEEIIKKLNVDSKGFGILTLNAELTDKETGDKSYFNEEFSLSRAAAPNPKVGTHVLLTHSALQRPYAYEILSTFEKAGFSTIRTTIHWQNFEKVPGVYKITDHHYDEMIATKKTNLDVMLLMTSGNILYTPTNGHMPAETQAQLDAWYGYVYNLVMQTKDYVSIYEIWNEPNLAPNFNPGYVPPEGYAKLCEYAYKAVKAADPSKIVLGMSQSNYGTQFIGDVLKAGGGEYMDGIAFHPYMWTQGPEAGQMGFIETLRKHVDDLGYSHLPFYVTEVGWQISVGLDEQAIYNTQMLILNHVHGNLIEKFWLFRFVESDNLDGEGFGFLMSPIHPDPFMARRHFPAVANFNRLMTNPTFEETKITADGLPLYHFALNDGRKAIITWNSAGGKKDVALDLGCNSVTVSDIYGKETVYTSDNGIFTFSVDKFPMYIMGDIKKSDIIQKMYYTDKDEIAIVGGSKAEFIITNNMAGNYEIEALPSPNLEIAEIKPLGDGRTKVVVSAPKDFITGESVVVNIKKDGNIYYSKRVDAKCSPAISAVGYVEHHTGNRWRLNVDVTNHMYDGEIAGKVEVDGPENFARWVPERKVSPVKGGETKSIKIPIPDFLGTSDAQFVGNLVMENGTKIDLSRTLTFKGMPYMRNVPTFDGVITEGEWNTSYMLEFGEGKSGNVRIAGEPYGGDDDFNAVMYYGWDKNNFYLAAEAYDDCFEIDHEGKNIWAGDSIQFAYALEKKASAKRTEITFGIGANTGGPELTRSSSLAPPSDGSRFIHELAVVNTPLEDGTNKTVYEMSIPWAEMFPAGFNINDHTQVLFSVLFNDRDNNVRESYYEIGSGIGGSKNPALHLEYNLMK